MQVDSKTLCNALKLDEHELLRRFPDLEKSAIRTGSGLAWSHEDVQAALSQANGLITRAMRELPSGDDDEVACEFDYEAVEQIPDSELVDRAEVQRMLGDEFRHESAKTFLLKYALFTGGGGLRWVREDIDFYRRVHLGD